MLLYIANNRSHNVLRRKELRMVWPKISVLLISLFILKTQAQPSNTTEPYNVCLSHVEPFVFCRGFNESEYTGFDVSLFRDAALRAGLGSAGNGYNFKCLPTFQGMLLNTLQGTCDIALSSITITVEREQLGLQFTYPYLASYLGIMVATTGEKVAGWNWTQPFSWDLWLATAVTLMIFPFCVVLIEFGSLKDKIRPKDCIRGNIESTSRSLWTMFGGETYDVSSFGAKVAVLCFSFMALILSSSYTANLASILTANNFNSEITSVNDLRGKAVTTNEIYRSRLQARYGIQSVPLIFISDASVVEAAYEVIAGSLSAVITDYSILTYISDVFKNCEAKLLPQGIEPFTIGMAFSPNMPQPEVSKFSSIILQMQEDDTIQRLRTDYKIGSTPACSEVSDNETAVTFSDVWGLWIILVAGMVFGFIAMFFTRYRKKKKFTRLMTMRNNPAGESGKSIMRERPSRLETMGTLVDPDDSDDDDDDDHDDAEDRNGGVLPVTNPAFNNRKCRNTEKQPVVAEER